MSTDDPPAELVDVFFLDDDCQDARLEDGLFVEIDGDGTVEGMSEEDRMVLDLVVIGCSTGL